MTYDLKVRENLPCFADNGKTCKVLAKKDCFDCNFYKPEIDHKLDRERALKRLKSLDEATQIYIADKYGIGGIV